jgi:hypothetical protein
MIVYCDLLRLALRGVVQKANLINRFSGLSGVGCFRAGLA